MTSYCIGREIRLQLDGVILVSDSAVSQKAVKDDELLYWKGEMIAAWWHHYCFRFCSIHGGLWTNLGSGPR